MPQKPLQKKLVMVSQQKCIHYGSFKVRICVLCVHAPGAYGLYHDVLRVLSQYEQYHTTSISCQLADCTVT